MVKSRLISMHCSFLFLLNIIWGCLFCFGSRRCADHLGAPDWKNEKHKENALYFQNIDRGPRNGPRNGHDLCWLLRDVFKSYREEIDEFVKYMAQPYKIPVLKKNDRAKIRTKTWKWDFDRKKKRSFLYVNIKNTYSTDILRSLYDQGTPDRSRWVQEAGNTFLAQIRLLRIGQNWLEQNT